MTTPFLHPDFVGKTPDEIADSLAAPGTPANAEYRDLLPRTLAPEARALDHRFFEARLARYRVNGRPVSKFRCENEALVNLARENSAWRSTVNDYGITEDHVKTAQAWYGPAWLITDDASRPGWPTSWWFRYAQTNWGKSRWHMVPDFSPAELALAGFDLVSTSRWMGDLADEEKLEFVMIQRKSEWNGDKSLKPEETARRYELLERMPFGGELPILDIDVTHAKKGPNGKDLTPEQIKEIHRERAQLAAKYAVGVTEIWRKITGVTPRWTVTNDRGGLHGLNLPLPPHVRHPDLLRALKSEIAKLCPLYEVGFKEKGEAVESSDPVSLDLTAYNKYANRRGGMWRVPLCAKPDGGSLPQVPVAEHVKAMPWLAGITPEALSSDWRSFKLESTLKITAVCVEHRRKVDEADIRHGNAFRDDSGKVKRVRREAAEANNDLGTAEFESVAKTIREVMPNGADEGIKRHNVRLAIAGWLYKHKIPKEAATATLLACGGNLDDSRKVVETTYLRGSMGDSIAGIHKIEELLGKKVASDLTDAYANDLIQREVMEPESSELEQGDVEEAKPQAVTEGSPEQVDEEEPEADHDHEPVPVAADPSKSWGASGAPEVPVPVEPAPAVPVAVKPEEKPKDQAQQGVPKSLTNPLSPHHLELVEAKKRLDEPRFCWNTTVPGGALSNTARVLAGIKAVTPSQKLWWIGKVVGGVFAFAGIGKQTINATSLRGNVKVEAVHTGYIEMESEIRRWRPGKVLPQIPSLFAIRKLVGPRLYSELLDAIQDDLRIGKAPFDVQWRALIDQGRSSEERDVLNWSLIDLVKSGTAASDYRLMGREWERLNRVVRCGRLANEKTCTDHGVVATISLNCEVEIGCRCCRSKLHGTIADWIKAKWYHEKYVIVEWKASTEPVLVDIRDDPDSAVYDPNRELEEEATIYVDPRSEKNRLLGLKKRFVLNHVTPSGERVPWVLKPRRRGRAKKGKRLGKVLSMHLLDRIKKGFSQTDDLKVLKLTTGNNLAYRGFIAPDGVFLVMPESFLEKKENGGMPEERNTLEHLKLIGVFKNCKTRLVTKDEMLSEVLHARMKIGEGFDRLLHQFMVEASEAPKTPPEFDEDGKPKKRELSETEVAVLTYPFLKNQSMRSIQNDAAVIELEWYTAESLRDFKAELRAEKYGPDEVKPNECPIPVLQPDGTTRPCRKIFNNALIDVRSRRILVQNSTGKHYTQDEAWATADQQAHGWGVQYLTTLGPSHEACAHGKHVHASC